MLGDCLLYALIDREEGLAGSPVPADSFILAYSPHGQTMKVGFKPDLHFAHELPTKGVDDARNRGCSSLADEVEVKHSLNCPRLEAVHEASGLVVEEGMSGIRT